MRFVIISVNRIDLFFRKVFILIITGYQKIRSLLFARPVCRFYPSCSEYSRQSFRKYNTVKALFLTLWRVLRCNPWNRGGYDPLP